MTLNPRKRKLLEALPKHNWKVAPAAREAGYSPIYADKMPKRILESALKDQAKEIAESLGANSSMTTKEIKESLAEMIGMSRANVFKRLESIANQDRDLGSALKVLLPLAKDLGVNLTQEETKTIVPVLNIGVRSLEEPTVPVENGSIEPYNPPSTP